MNSGKLDQELHVLPRLVGSDVSNNEDLSAWKELLDNLAKELLALNTLVTKSGPKVGTHFGQYENIGQHMARTQIVLQSLQSVDTEAGSKQGSVEQVSASLVFCDGEQTLEFTFLLPLLLDSARLQLSESRRECHGRL